jgi:hypothetical protein
MVKGSCLCGQIAYEISGEFTLATYCHCKQCRKSSGSSFATNASVNSTDFRFTAGESLLSRFESSPGQFRCFCSICGSPVVKIYADNPQMIRIRLGALDDDSGVEIGGHFFTAEKAEWYRICDDLPQH